MAWFASMFSLYSPFESVAGEEAVYDRGVVVVLVLCRFHRLRFDQERSLEADAVLLVDDEMEKAC